MAKPTTYKGSLVAIYLEDPDTPETYIKPCGLNSHSVSFTKNAQEINVPDCDDPEAPQWVERDVESLDFSASGEGILAAEAIGDWWGYFNSTEPVNARIYVGATDDDENGHYWEGAVHVNSFEVSGQTGQRATVSVGIVSSGEMTFNPVPAPGP
jgi:hypothetical protein